MTQPTDASVGSDFAIAKASDWLDPEHRVVRALRFLRDEPFIATVGRGHVSVTDHDHAAETINVAGGKVTTYDRIDVFNAKPGGGYGYDVKAYGFEYEGADARNTDWLLFFAPEAEMYDAKGNSLEFETDVESLYQGKDRVVQWGTTKAPKCTLDGEGDVAPFYEAPARRRSTAACTPPPTSRLRCSTAPRSTPLCQRRTSAS